LSLASRRLIIDYYGLRVEVKTLISKATGNALSTVAALQAVKMYSHTTSAKRCYWQDVASGKLPVLNLLTGQKSGPQGRLVAPIQVKLGMADRHLGSLSYAKFHVNRRRGWECGHQNIKKIPLFSKESPPRGEPFDRFLKFLRAFIQITILH